MLTRRSFLAATGAAAPALILTANVVRAATPEIYAEGGIAIDGTDPTSYFTAGAPIAGDPSISLQWRGATWQFANAEARALFEGNPEGYAPQFGGYCAWAVAQGYTASTVPEAWKIVDGRLYLNFSRRIQRRWERDIPGNIAKAEGNWPGVLTA